MSDFKSFLIRLFYITGIMETISAGWFYAIPSQFTSPTQLVLPIFFMALTIMLHKFLVSATEQKFQNFLNRYLIATTVKLIGLLIIIFIYAFLNPSDAIVFVISFFINYLVFTLFEAAAHIKKAKNS